MKTVGRYEIHEKLGQGGMGTVYKAFDPLLQRVLAVKVISGQLDANPEHRERFFREARAAAQLSHRNIITIHDLGEQDGTPFLAMEYLEGRDLDRRLSAPEGLSLALKVELAIGIAEGLAHAHACGVIHRDIKPANIFVTDDGVVKILDFGLARLLTSELTRSSLMVGTVNYMAPEQLRGDKADHRADIFSFGVLLYEMLGGRKPFQGESAAATMYKILHEVPEALERLDPTLGPPLTTVVDRAMAKAREDRYQQMTDLLRDLDAVYQRMSDADRRVVSRVATALRPPSGSRRLSPAPGSAPDEETVAVPTEDMRAAAASAATVLAERPLPAAEPRPFVTPPAQPGLPRHWRTGLLALAGLAVFVVGAWFLAGRAAPETPAEAPVQIAAVSEPAPVARPEAPAEPTAPPPAPAEPPASPREEPRAREAPPAAPRPAPDTSADRLRATAALTLMETVKAAAARVGARELAAELFAAAEREEARARGELRDGRFQSAAGRLDATATLYRAAGTAAEAEARNRAARERAAEEARRREAAAAARPAPPAVVVPAPSAPPPQRVPAAPETAAPPSTEVIGAVLQRYRRALEARDISALKAVWPSLSGGQQAAIEAEFANARSIEVDLASPRIEVAGATATITTRRHYQIRTRDGQQLRSETMTTLALRLVSGTWVIESVRHRPIG